MKWSVPGKEVDQRKLQERLWKKDCQACKLNREDSMDCNRWRKQIRDNWVVPDKIQKAVKRLCVCDDLECP